MQHVKDSRIGSRVAMDEYIDAKKKALRAEYVARINRVIDYIEANLI